MGYLLKHKNIILNASVLLIALSVTSVLVFGFKLGIDFTSGSLWQIRALNTNPSELREFLSSDLGVDELNISFDEANNVYAITLREINENERQEFESALGERFEGVESVEFSTISPSISSELRQKAELAVIFVLVGISLFIAFAFRKVSEPIKSWKYGIITLITLFHDVVIPAGIFALLGKTAGITIDTNFMVAMLFVMGFSVNDTIVVFDRIRENLIVSKERKERKTLEEIVDKSILETVARSVNTSLTLVVILIALFFLGPVSTKLFVLAILIGTIAGTYSSIFFANPLLLLAERYSRNPQK
jgi:preprotein translocase subunit SecF